MRLCTGCVVATLAVTSAIGSLSCAPVAALPVATERSAPVGPFATATREQLVTVEVRALAWSGVPRDLDETCTPIHVRVRNDGGRSLALSSGSFELLSAARSFARLFPDQIPGATASTTAAELKPGVVEPGETAAGFLFFERIDGDYSPLALRLAVVDAESRDLVDTIDVPFWQRRLSTCDHTRLEASAPWSHGEVFDTCLIPH
jgi:hypothetical protein